MNDTAADDTTAKDTAGWDPETLAGILTEEQKVMAMRTYATMEGEFDEKAQEAFGVNADGSIAEGGLTEAGQRFAHAAVHAITDLVNERRARKRKAAAGPTNVDLSGLSSLGGIVEALDLRGPVRVALRAAAQALAVALNDGASDDDEAADMPTGMHMENSQGGYTIKVDRAPFLLLQAVQPEGSPFGSITVVSGGGLKYAQDAEEGELTIEQVIDIAARGVEAAGEGAVGWVGPGEVPNEVQDALIDHLNETFGPGAGAAAQRARKTWQRRTDGADAAAADVAFQTLVDQAVVADEAFPPGAPSASGAGTSTEAPSMPHWDSPARSFPTFDPGTPSETPAPSAPVREDQCEPAPSTSGGSTDGAGSHTSWSSSPDTSSSSSDTSSSTSDSAGSTGSCGE